MSLISDNKYKSCSDASPYPKACVYIILKNLPLFVVVLIDRSNRFGDRRSIIVLYKHPNLTFRPAGTVTLSMYSNVEKFLNLEMLMKLQDSLLGHIERLKAVHKK
ncbi:hypothetical protein GQX74_001543 [Glossina fuscipes]|nr:hypothetical protein GQX74_001543 [Glossina fuscipes]